MTNLETILEKIVTKLDKIIELQEAQVQKKKSSTELLLEKIQCSHPVDAIGREHNFPTPWNTPAVYATVDDVLPACTELKL